MRIGIYKGITIKLNLLLHMSIISSSYSTPTFAHDDCGEFRVITLLLHSLLRYSDPTSKFRFT